MEKNNNINVEVSYVCNGDCANCNICENRNDDTDVIEAREFFLKLKINMENKKEVTISI